MVSIDAFLSPQDSWALNVNKRAVRECLRGRGLRASERGRDGEIKDGGTKKKKRKGKIDGNIGIDIDID
jgi:hypothetical protein